MGKIEKLINERRMPDALLMNNGKRAATPEEFLARREEIKEILAEREYGVIPPAPKKMKVEITERDDIFCAGKAPLEKLLFTFEDESGKEYSFPAYAVVPAGKTNIPAFVHINFRSAVPDKYMLSEEIADRGYATFSFCYQDVAKDSDDFRSGIAPFLGGKRKRKNSPGKIAMWAWAAMRMMDYIMTREEIDKDNVAVIGHSRLGKTALVAGGYDERFKYIISNDSGCSGAAISRGKGGESVKRINEVFPFWFAKRYNENADNFEECGFDQNFLLTLSVPRHIMIGSAEEDLWADPISEFLNLASMKEAYSIFGKRGLVHKNRIPTAKAFLGEGDALYQIRHGMHYFSREDWSAYMDYIDSVRAKKV